MENLFEMGANFEEEWTSNNKDKASKQTNTEIKEPDKHQLHFAKEKRRGKVVTVVRPFYLSKNDLKILLKTLKKKLGTGGTVREDSLEFQGNIPNILRKDIGDLGSQLSHIKPSSF